MDRTITRLGNVDMMPKLRFSWGPCDTLGFTGTSALPRNPETALDANAPVPIQRPQMFHQRSISKPTSGAEDNLTLERKQWRSLVQDIFVGGLCHTAAGMVQYGPHQRDSPPTIDDRHAHHTVDIPQQ